MTAQTMEQKNLDETFYGFLIESTGKPSLNKKEIFKQMEDLMSYMLAPKYSKVRIQEQNYEANRKKSSLAIFAYLKEPEGLIEWKHMNFLFPKKSFEQDDLFHSMYFALNMSLEIAKTFDVFEFSKMDSLKRVLTNLETYHENYRIMIQKAINKAMETKNTSESVAPLDVDIISRTEIIGRLKERLVHMLSPAYRNLFVDYHTITKKDDRVDLVFTFFLTEPRNHEGLFGSNTIGYEIKTLPKLRIPYKGWNIKEDEDGLNALLDAHIEKITSELKDYFTSAQEEAGA